MLDKQTQQILIGVGVVLAGIICLIWLKPVLAIGILAFGVWMFLDLINQTVTNVLTKNRWMAIFIAGPIVAALLLKLGALFVLLVIALAYYFMEKNKRS